MCVFVCVSVCVHLFLCMFLFLMYITFLVPVLQYLKDEEEDLVSPPNTEGNQWVKFLKESTHLKGSSPHC